MKNKLQFFLILLITLCGILLGQSAIDIAKNCLPSTVFITMEDQHHQPLTIGSGFIVGEGKIVTNLHVIEGAKFGYVLLIGDETIHKIDGYLKIDEANDLALLSVPTVSGKILPLFDGEYPEIGERIYAIGNPKGLSGTISEGIVSGIREIENNKVIQITAPISPGSSGGPVINSKSEVVGIAFAGYTDGQNLNFAIPVKYLKILNNNIGLIKPISKNISEIKTSSTTVISPNIKEGITIRNLRLNFMNRVEFSIKNNLGYKVTDIKILFLIYDNSDTIVDYIERTFHQSKGKPQSGIKPYLAKSYGSHSPIVTDDIGVALKVKARVLDYNIVEE